MRVGLISDIHGNLSALQAVLADLDGLGVSNVLCLGDVIGYGPFPGECIDLVQQHCSVVLKGNHEEALLDGAESANFNPRARRAIDWTRQHLQSSGDADTIKRRWFLFESLRTQARSGPYTFVHASPRDPTKEYVLPRECRSLEKMTAIFALIDHLCCVGHTHVPGIFLENGTFTPPEKLWGGTWLIEPDEKSLVNIGSVGQPRDGDPRACYAVLDLEDPKAHRIVFRRVAYDVESTMNAIRANPQLDDSLAERLRHGR